MSDLKTDLRNLAARVLYAMPKRAEVLPPHGPRLELFDPSRKVNAARGEELDGLADPANMYLILFTPRSGSSWLSDLLMRSGGLGTPGEYFNPTFVPKYSKAVGASDPETYTKRVGKHFAKDDVFAAKAAANHAYQMSGSVAGFLRTYPDAKLLWLIREDIVAQAVSLFMMRFQTQTHNVNGKGVSFSREPTYDGAEIAQCLKALSLHEHRMEEALSLEPRPVLRLSQEKMLASDPNALVERIRAHVGADPSSLSDAPSSRHSKGGRSINGAFKDRFLDEHAWHVAKVLARRRRYLSKVTPVL